MTLGNYAQTPFSQVTEIERMVLLEKSTGYQRRTHKLDEVIDRLGKTKVQGKVLEKLTRYTLGADKLTCAISVRMLAEKTGCGKNNVCRALQSFASRNIIQYEFKSTQRGIPSIVELKWLAPYLEENRRARRSNVIQGNFPKHDKKAQEQSKKQEPSLKTDKSTQESLMGLNLVPDSSFIDCTQNQESPFVPKLGTKERGSYIDNFLINLQYYSLSPSYSCSLNYSSNPPLVTVVPGEVLENSEIKESLDRQGNFNASYTHPVVKESTNDVEVMGNYQRSDKEALKANCAQMSPCTRLRDKEIPNSNSINSSIQKPEKYQTLRKLLVERWNDLKSTGRGWKINREKEFFSQVKIKYPNDLNLIYLTLLKFEKEGKDFGNYPVPDPLTKLNLKWSGIRETAEKFFGDQAHNLSLPFEQYQAKQNQRQEQVRIVSEMKSSARSAIQINEEVSMDDQVRAFEERYPGDAKLDAIRKWSGGFFKNLELRSALVAAAGCWFISDERKAELAEFRSCEPMVVQQKSETPQDLGHSRPEEQDNPSDFIPEENTPPIEFYEEFESLPVMPHWDSGGQLGDSFSRLGVEFLERKPLRKLAIIKNNERNFP